MIKINVLFATVLTWVLVAVALGKDPGGQEGWVICSPASASDPISYADSSSYEMSWEKNEIEQPGTFPVKRYMGIAVDVGYRLYQDFGQDTLGMKYWLFHVIEEVSKVYERELGIKLDVSFFLINRTDERYTNPGVFDNRWKTDPQLRNAPRNISLYLTSGTGGSAGLVVNTCDSSQHLALVYELSRSSMLDIGNISLNVIAHEMGHSFGSNHTHEGIGEAAACNIVEGGGAGDIMSYCDSRDMHYIYNKDLISQQVTSCHEEVPSLPGIPVLEPVINSESPYLFWSRVYAADLYDIEVSEDNSFVDPIVKSQSSFQAFKMPKVDGGKTYYWRVRAVNSNGAGNWSQTGSFAFSLPALTYPALLSPKNNRTNVDEQAMKLQWSALPLATGYDLQVTKVSDMSFSNPLFNQRLQVSEFTLTPALIGGGAWERERHNLFVWRVRAVRNGNTSAWSPGFSFKPSPAPVALISPNGERNIPAGPKTLSWRSPFRNTISQASGRRTTRLVEIVQVATDAGFKNLVYDSTTVAPISLLAEVNRSRSISLVAGTNYYWRVKTYIDEPLLGWHNEDPGWSFADFSTVGAVSIENKIDFMHKVFIQLSGKNEHPISILFPMGFGQARLNIVDGNGKKAASLSVNEGGSTFYHLDLPTGKYFYRMQGSHFVEAHWGNFIVR